jgi:carbamoyl-phosphate synthase large subunit
VRLDALALELNEAGVLSRYGVLLIGAQVDAIRKAEDRKLFKEAMTNCGLNSARSGVAHTVEEAREIVKETGYPVILRPSFTMGGSGGAVVEKPEDLDAKVAWALLQSPNTEVLVEESLIGWNGRLQARRGRGRRRDVALRARSDRRRRSRHPRRRRHS